MKIVLIDFYHESNVKDKDVIVVKPRDFTKEDDNTDVRQYIIDLAVNHLLEKNEIVEGNFKVQIWR